MATQPTAKTPKKKPPTVVGGLTFQSAMQVQVDHLMKAAVRAQERGYCVMISNMNKSFQLDEQRFPFGYMTGGFGQVVKAWNESHGARIQIIWVSFVDREAMFQGHFHFSMETPELMWSRPLIANLRLFSRVYYEKDKRYTGAGLFDMKHGNGVVKLNGSNLPAFQSLLRILETPEHRAALTGSKVRA